MKVNTNRNTSLFWGAFAFNRVELFVTLAVFGLVALVVLPALANNRPRSSRIMCVNNLRQIGIAQQLWGNDHNDLPPLMVSVAEGGTRAHPLAANAWLHFAWLSNELVHPRLLFCPSDTGRPAEDFTGNASSGYLNPNFANQATSYFTSYSSVGGDLPGAVVNGDRNVTLKSVNGFTGCIVLNSASVIDTLNTLWKTNLHNLEGNIQLRDGRVQMVAKTGLRAALSLTLNDNDNGTKHVAIPR